VIRNDKETPIKYYQYLLIDPEGYEYRTNDIVSFCKNKNIDYRTIARYYNKGKIKLKYKENAKIETINCENWQSFNDKSKEKIKKINYLIYDKDGNEYKVHHLGEFCKEMSLSARTFRSFFNRLVEMKVRKNYTQTVINTIGWKIIRL